MQIPANDSPFWKILTYIVVGAILCIMLALSYKNGWSQQDFITLVATLAGLFGVHATQALAAPKFNVPPKVDKN